MSVLDSRYQTNRLHASIKGPYCLVLVNYLKCPYEVHLLYLITSIINYNTPNKGKELAHLCRS